MKFNTFFFQHLESNQVIMNLYLIFYRNFIHSLLKIMQFKQIHKNYLKIYEY